MEKIKSTQRNATRNQSSLDFERQNLFTFGNRYAEATLENNTGAEMVATAGFLVVRGAAANEIRPAIAGATLANVIGILNVNGEITLANDEKINANYCLSGDINEELLTLPDTVTLDTVVSGKSVRDILTGLGFVLHSVTENSKFGN